MRTTFDLDLDILQAVRELAEARGQTMGQVLSGLAREALETPATDRVKNGVPLLPRRKPGSSRPTMRLVNELREEA
jgi:hypothetical protein